MRVKQPSRVNNRKGLFPARSRANDLLAKGFLKSDYEAAFEFALKFNARQYRLDGKILTESVREKLEEATKNYILAGQARRIAPRDLKRQIATTVRKKTNNAVWVAEPKLEQQFSVMAGSPHKARVK